MLETVDKEVRQLLPTSGSHYELARRFIPRGSTRARFWWPHPLYVDRAEGPYLFDVDHRRYVDCNLGFGPLILGHRHERVERAIAEQLTRGVQLGAPSLGEYELARRLVTNVAGAERAIFLSSGTEATLTALRLARVATGKENVAKFEGGWHGAQDFLLHSYTHLDGAPERPLNVVESAGVAPDVTRTVVTLPYNSPDAATIIREQKDSLAGVIFEPVQGGAGCIPGDPDFLRAVAEACHDSNVVLIADEVITGFRLRAGGAAEASEVQPDLTVCGKVIGGGLPVGAVCGRADLVDRVVPPRSGDLAVTAGSTHAANPLTTAAGTAQLDVLLEDPGIYNELDALGNRLRSELTALVDRFSIPAHITGTGSMWGIHFTETRPASMRDQHSANETAARALAALLLQEGVLLASPAHLGFLSAVHGDHHVDEVVAAHQSAFERMKDAGVV